LKSYPYLLRICNICCCILLLAALGNTTYAQEDFMRKAQGRLGSMGGSGGTGDSIQHRTGLEDSITIRFRYLDSSRMRGFDSVLYDFTKVFPTPWDQVHLGNFGTASRHLLFSPLQQAGWDPGFHAFDVYKLRVDETRFYNSTRPYSELNYLLGSKSEQFIRLMHTQNIRYNWNISIEYRLLNSPGTFVSQNTNHNNYRITSWYQSPNKRYQNFFVLVANKLQSAENGGIVSESLLDSTQTSYKERSNIPTNLGADPTTGGIINPFNTNIGTGNFYTNATYLFRQQYDLGQKDSIVTDSTVVPLFYPRLRLEHTISYNTYHYRYKDQLPNTEYYGSLYNIKPFGDSARQELDTIYIRDYWKSMVNDFSIYTFPDAKNAQQFFKAGVSWQTLQGSFDTGTVTKNYYNFLVHGEYRNKSRNQKWDIEANGNFYINGLNAGDYHAYLSLKRLISRQIGYLQLGFQNTNRTPSFIFDPQSSFYLDSKWNIIRISDPGRYSSIVELKKENITNLFASFEQPKLKLKLTGNYFLVTNYTYFSSFYERAQASSLFNVLQVSAEKIFRLGRNWNWKTWIVMQQRIGDGPVNLPLISTRNQIGYDGTLGFKNLRISFGLESRYFTEYKAPQYSPVIGQFVFQDTANVRMKRPDIGAYLHFRIKSFTAYVRAENLNTINPTEGGFTKNNVPTIGYPYPGMQIRVGIYWSFVN
jgi:hypothetical protein